MRRKDIGTVATSTKQVASRGLLGNAVRGMLLLVDVIVGVVLAWLGLDGFMIPLNEGGPFSLKPPAAILYGLSATLGVWLIVSGVLLGVLKRPKCWRTGVWTHTVIAMGVFLYIPAFFYQADYVLQVRPGHMAMEAAAATGIISIMIAAVGGMWLVAAAILRGCHRFGHKCAATNTLHENATASLSEP